MVIVPHDHNLKSIAILVTKMDSGKLFAADVFITQNAIFYLTLFEKSNFCPKFQFWQNPNIFTSFPPNFFLTIFLVKSKLSTAKKFKTTTFSRVFHPKNRQFSREIKVEFLDKKWRFGTVCIESDAFPIIRPTLASLHSIEKEVPWFCPCDEGPYRMTK